MTGDQGQVLGTTVHQGLAEEAQLGQGVVEGQAEPGSEGLQTWL